jgi:hypothetical protein
MRLHLARQIPRCGRGLALACVLSLGAGTNACHRWTHLRIEVVSEDPSGPRPVEGAKVRLLSPEDQACADPPLDNPRYAGLRTGSDGVATDSHPTCARMKAVVYKPGHALVELPIDSCRVEPAATLTVRVVLSPEATLEPLAPACQAVQAFFAALAARRWEDARALIAAGADLEVGEHSHPDDTGSRRHARFVGIRCTLLEESRETATVGVALLYDDGCRLAHTARLERAPEGFRLSAFSRD